MKKIYTVGHSNKSIEEFVALLNTRSIALVVDVRSRPFSKYVPQFNRPNLAHALSRAGIEYLYRGKNLGGLDVNVQQDETIEELVELAKENDVRLALMCSEAKADQNCHRYTILTPLFEARGIEVEHLVWN